MLTTDFLSHAENIRHGFFTREGGISQGIYKSRNCGFGSGDRPEKVHQNREIALKELGLKGAVLATVQQVHSTMVVEVVEPWKRENMPKADGMVSRTEGVALGILTADCAPVLFADSNARVVGAAHAGWRGAKDGILRATIEAMVELGSDVRNIKAAVGPCIRQPSYEVGPEFQRAFIVEDSSAETFFIPSSQPDYFMFDLAGFVERQIRSLGLWQVDIVDVDTYRDENCFFSYRRATHRGESDYGRGLSAIILTK
jgi:YfiH family protein